MQTKLIEIGNSKGVRLPRKLIKKYHFHDRLTLEELNNGILIKSSVRDNRLSWEETYKEMAKEQEDWSDFAIVSDDELD